MQSSCFRLKCDSVVYRKGFIEVTPAIHDGCVNIETWGIDADTNLEHVAWVDDVSDSSVVANCELEMTLDPARNLAESILAAIQSTEHK